MKITPDLGLRRSSSFKLSRCGLAIGGQRAGLRTPVNIRVLQRVTFDRPLDRDFAPGFTVAPR